MCESKWAGVWIWRYEQECGCQKYIFAFLLSEKIGKGTFPIRDFPDEDYENNLFHNHDHNFHEKRMITENNPTRQKPFGEKRSIVESHRKTTSQPEKMIMTMRTSFTKYYGLYSLQPFLSHE